MPVPVIVLVPVPAPVPMLVLVLEDPGVELDPEVNTPAVPEPEPLLPPPPPSLASGRAMLLLLQPSPSAAVPTLLLAVPPPPPPVARAYSSGSIGDVTEVRREPGSLATPNVEPVRHQVIHVMYVYYIRIDATEARQH